MESLPHIAVVDDHEEIRELVGRYLSQHGYRVTVAENAAAFRKVLGDHEFDLVILDLMMPGEDGLSLCRYLRVATSLPLIFLTAMAEDTDRIVGLELGADDYLAKPFNPRELLARVRAVLRRSHPSIESEKAGKETLPEEWRFADKTLHLARQEVTGEDGVAVPLSTAEFRLLCVFLTHPGEVISRDTLIELTSGREAGAWDRSIDNQVSRLRRKIEADPRTPVLIKTHWGDGYCFTGKVTPG